MNKIKFLAIAAVFSFGVANAQVQGAGDIDETLQFVDADGNIVPDGSTVTIYAEYLIPGIPELLQADFLRVKNTTNETASASFQVRTLEMSSGRVQWCYPSECLSGGIPENYTSDSGDFSAGEIKTLNSEWKPEEGKYGDARFTIQIRVMDKIKDFPAVYEFLAYGPTVTLHCIYADPTGIENLESDKNATIVARYNANGQIVSSPVKGINILKLSNGKTVKQIIK